MTQGIQLIISITLIYDLTLTSDSQIDARALSREFPKMAKPFRANPVLTREYCAYSLGVPLLSLTRAVICPPNPSQFTRPWACCLWSLSM